MRGENALEVMAQVVVAEGSGEAFELARTAYDALAAPLFWLRSDGELAFANAAFSQLGPSRTQSLIDYARTHLPHASDDSPGEGASPPPLPCCVHRVETDDGFAIYSEVSTSPAGLQEPMARRITDLGPNLVSIFDLEKQTTAFANVRWQELHGLTEAEMEKGGLRLLTERIHPEDLGLFYSVAQQLGEAEEGAVIESEYRIQNAHGQWRRIHTWDSVFGLGPQGDVRSVLSTALDVTEQREREESIRESERHLRQVQKLESLGVLAGGIAHDFNNLLTGILGYADLLGRALPEDSEPSGYAHEIGVLAERAGQLCERILTYGGRTLESPSDLDLSQVVRESASLARPSLGKGTRLSIDLHPTPLPILGNEIEVLQMGLNAILNGAEALAGGDGAVWISTRPVEVGTARLAGHLGAQDARPGWYAELCVRDEGHGVDADTRERMFDPFFTTKGQGRGLGLSAVIGIVRAHGGILEVESEVGRGTTFRALFPLRDPEHAQAEETGSPKRHEKIYARVLIIDDEVSVREIASRILELAGCVVVTAETAREGLEAIAAPQAAFDAILIDITLPDISGLVIAERLRRDGCEAAIILTSGFASERPLPDGFPHFLPKPFGDVALRRCIAEALAASGRLAPVRALRDPSDA